MLANNWFDAMQEVVWFASQPNVTVDMLKAVISGSAYNAQCNDEADVEAMIAEFEARTPITRDAMDIIRENKESEVEVKERDISDM